MVKLKNLQDYLDYAGGVGIDVWAMRNDVKTGKTLYLGKLMVKCFDVDGDTYYNVYVYNSYCQSWDVIAIGKVGHSPEKFSLCGRHGDKDGLFELITKLRFLGIELSMTNRHEEWEDIYLAGKPISRDLRFSWIDTPPEDCGPLD